MKQLPDTVLEVIRAMLLDFNINAPSLDEVKAMCKSPIFPTMPLKQHRSSLGNLFYYNDPIGIIKNEIANPLVSAHLHQKTLQQDSATIISELWHGTKWSECDVLKPVMIRENFKTFFVKDTVKFSGLGSDPDQKYSGQIMSFEFRKEDGVAKGYAQVRPVVNDGGHLYLSDADIIFIPTSSIHSNQQTCCEYENNGKDQCKLFLNFIE
jgi:hypothetical protein